MYKIATIEVTKVKVVVIAPYSGLKELIESIAKDDEEINIQVEIGDLQEGVELAKIAEKNGADVIISRGGTAKLIQDEVRIPVIEIEVSTIDLLRVFTLVKDNPEKKGVVGFKAIIENATTICSLLDINISAFVVYKEDDVIPQLIELQRDGYHIIVGDAITVRNAENLGMNGFLLTSGRESVLKAFEEAKKVNSLFSSIIKKALIPRIIVEQTEIAIAVFDRSTSIVFLNEAGKRIENLLKNATMERLVNQILDKGEVTTIIEANESIWNLTGYQLNYTKETLFLISLCLVTDKKGKRVQGIRVNTPIHDISLNSLNWFLAQNHFMKKVIEKAKIISLHDEPIWISGEDGTGKEQMAYLIHLGSKRSMYPFLIVDCDIVNEEHWDMLLEKKHNNRGIFSSNENGTIYLKRIEQLSLNSQKKLLEYLNKKNMSFRFIVSSVVDIEKRFEKNLFSHELFYKLCELNLTIPPLRERIEDIEEFINLFINKFNYKYGKQLAGIRHDALEELKKYKWPGNVDQLIQVMKQIVLLAEGVFIEKADLEGVLENNKYDTKGDILIGVTGTLKEIELDIIKKVFLEEDMSHSKTAKRLGINRSTLWRKLKVE